MPPLSPDDDHQQRLQDWEYKKDDRSAPAELKGAVRPSTNGEDERVFPPNQEGEDGSNSITIGITIDVDSNEAEEDVSHRTDGCDCPNDDDRGALAFHHQHHHHQRQQLWPLHVIPERRVVFSGTLLKSSNGIHRKALFYDTLEIFEIGHRSEYTMEEKRGMWYNRRELMEIRNSCAQTAFAVSQYAGIDELYCPIHFRGLEYLIDSAIFHNSDNDSDSSDDEESKTPDTEKDDCGEVDSSLRTSESGRWNALRAVLNEQTRQRMIFPCLRNKNYFYHKSLVGKIMNNTNNEERVRSVYTVHTQESSSASRRMAHLDESHVRELRQEEEEKEDVHNSTGTNTGNSNHRQKDKSYDYDDCCHQQLSSGIVLGIFQKIATPFLDSFLEIRKGDIHIDIGQAHVVL